MKLWKQRRHAGVLQPERRWWRWLKRIGWIGVTLVLILTILPVAIHRFWPVSWTPLMVIRAAQNLPPEPRHWVPLSRMGQVPGAVLAAEDQRFFVHGGLDWQAIDRAVRYNAHHEDRRGASTISQQTAKNLWLWPGRDWLRKGLELWLTLWLEGLWTKERILEVYLNIIEWGPGVYGVEAAARHWYQKPASALSRREAASLAVIVPRPLTSHPRQLSAAQQARLAWVLQQMRLGVPQPAGED